MASILSAGTTTSTALNLTADVSGALQLASNNGTTALTINTTQAIGVGSSPSYGTNGQVLTSSGSGAAPTWTTVSAASLTTPSFTSTIGVGGATASASGAGITFPASQSASSNANTLDDYEEGTWTPSDGSGAGLTFTNVYANYTKIGRFAFFEFQVTYPSTASGADTRINGFPFNNIDDYEGKPGVCLVAGQGSGFITQKQGSNYGYIVNASNSNITNNQASTRTARGAQYYETV